MKAQKDTEAGSYLKTVNLAMSAFFTKLARWKSAGLACVRPWIPSLAQQKAKQTEEAHMLSKMDAWEHKKYKYPRRRFWLKTRMDVLIDLECAAPLVMSTQPPKESKVRHGSVTYAVWSGVR
jgi:hypothetical protein